MTPAPNVILVAPPDDILEVTARQVLARAEALPDLTHQVVLLPDLEFAPRLRRQLLEQAEGRGQRALLGPVISTLRHWLDTRYPVTRPVPGRARRELLLIEVLQQHPGVFPGNDPWQIAPALITLFDELTLHRVPVPGDAGAFVRQLQAAYGITDRLPEPLGLEAGIVHRLWHAWHAQLDAMGLLDPGMAYLQQLARCRDDPGACRLTLAGFDTFSAAERDWLGALLDAGRAHCILYRPYPPSAAGESPPLPAPAPAEPEPTDPATACLDAVFQSTGIPLAERARDTARRYPVSPLAGRLALFAADSAEQEARAIELQVRRWLLERLQPLGILTEDRRLARRVRALLERAGIELQDSGGWALSTTSAAAALERWLETVEEDFAYQPLLDVLKSPFSFPEHEPARFNATVYRLERDIIRHEGIARGLARYRRHLELRQERLPEGWPQQAAADLGELLNRLDHAAEPLRAVTGNTRTPPLQLLDALRRSLEELGMWSAFDSDPAGQRILQEWQQLAAAAHHSHLDMHWLEFRAWLGTALERHDFRPATAGSPILLLTLEQARLGQYAGLVIGACDREHLPGATTRSPFFNDPVRAELGLPVWPQHYARQLQRFRRVLQSAPSVLLTWHSDANGEPRLPSPWVEALQGFHRCGWGRDLAERELPALLENPGTRVRGNNPLPAPPPAGYPAPSLPPGLLPRRLSVSAHGDLIDCPYRFFAAHGLGLRPKESIREALEKATYGERVHLCLELFHQGREPWPGPFREKLTAGNRAAAITLLETISDAVFAWNLEDNFEHRAWRRRWKELIPAYIDWQTGREQAWDFATAETQTEIRLENGSRLHGRLDRIDSGPPGQAIIDYKTGNPPHQEEVLSGEKVQLPSYVLLAAKPPVRVEYLQLDGGVTPGARLEGEALEQLAPAVGARLVQVLEAIKEGAPLPAWGDPGACRYCDMDAICRRQAWLEPTPGDTGAGQCP